MEEEVAEAEVAEDEVVEEEMSGRTKWLWMKVS